jgi:hypothetical protein
MSGDAAVATAWGRGIEASWSIRGGKKAWEDPETQGGLPSTVDEFWSLTGAGRLKLISPPGTLDSIESDIASLEADRKRLKTIIDAPTPPTPDTYTGPPIHEIEDQIREIEQKLSRHNMQVSANAKLESTETEAAARVADKQRLTGILQGLNTKLSHVNAELEKANTQLAIYQEASSKEPKIVSSARGRGVPLRVAVQDTVHLLVQAVQWANPKAATQEWSDLICSQIPEGELELPESATFKSTIPEADGLRVYAASGKLSELSNKYANEIKQINTALDKIEAVTMATAGLKPSFDCILDDQALFAAHASISTLKQQVQAASAWDAYEAAMKKQVEARNKAFMELEGVATRLETAKKRLTEEVQKLKGPIESKANEMLGAAGLSNLYVSVNQNGRGWTLDVSIDDVAIESLARSKRLLYGLCLVAAIHELSNAKAPILTVECAEMDHRTFEKAIAAMKVKRKGNVILEHWSKPDVDVAVIDLSCGVLV